ncbi:Uncharacterised protein [BD1-7 clade bacterium]|uniref:Uncharacterized protein n=1 Tax=BD1-7 clade bacterium TaxID=2029982 RepID=A0A5S9QDS8_9GAMM|nr:Uncharacterised protein [BD1-7 clade bacterium]CAA0116529.1 Uncharacterised protein [BD1-7 clade bacterium]
MKNGSLCAINDRLELNFNDASASKIVFRGSLYACLKSGGVSGASGMPAPDGLVPESFCNQALLELRIQQIQRTVGCRNPTVHAAFILDTRVS